MNRRQVRAAAACAAFWTLTLPLAAEETRESLLETARGGAGEARTAALRRLGMLREERALPVLLAAAEAGEMDARRAAIEALGTFARPDLVPRLGALAVDADSRIAGDAARALGSAGLPAVPALVDALRHASPGVREAAEGALVRACGVRGSADVLAGAWKSSGGDRFAFLAAILATDAPPRTRLDALRALPEEPRAAALLVTQLESGVETVREAARGRLEKLACRRMDDAGWRNWLAREPRGPVVAWRAAALLDPANPDRLAAARALAVPDPAAVRALVAAAGDAAVAETALASLPVATGLLARPLEDWAAWWSVNRGRTRLEWLLAALVDAGDAPNRAAAARSLSTLRDRRAVDWLVACALPDADPVVRAAADQSLATLLAARPVAPETWDSLWKRLRPDWK